MTCHQATTPTPTRGRHWLFAAIVMPTCPLLLGLAVQQSLAWRTCVAHHASSATTALHGPCTVSYTGSALAALGFWAVAGATTVAGLITGLVAGRRRRRFGGGRPISMTVIGVCAPWAVGAYAVGYGLGRLRPARHPGVGRQPRDEGWAQAVRLYRALAYGHQPPTLFAPDFTGQGGVYLDVPMRLSRFYGMDVTYQPGGMFAVGSPGVVAGAAIGHVIGSSIGYARAASLSRRRWRDGQVARVVVTATATWCQVRGQWLCFEHAAVTGYWLSGDQSCVLSFPDVAPVRLCGPAACCHVVLFAYLRDGAGWQHAPFLHPLRYAAQGVSHPLATP